MRVYFDKPRTSIGWKGFLNDPHLDGRCDVQTGLNAGRALLVELSRLGMPIASELLDPITTPYIADLLSWAAIGARTSESQPHREMASGLGHAVGIKNPTCGNLEEAVNGLRAARHPHTRIAVGPDGTPCVERTSGNPDAHLILRGGRSGPNYDADSVATAARQLEEAGIDTGIVVDASHANSGKNHRRQSSVLRDIARRLARGCNVVRGVMLESHLREGNQTLGATLRYGTSVTDACLSFDETAQLLRELALAKRASLQSAPPKRRRLPNPANVNSAAAPRPSPPV
jgi:3-deoxy-7-phosphoheptulonate synthase